MMQNQQQHNHPSDFLPIDQLIEQLEAFKAQSVTAFASLDRSVLKRLLTGGYPERCIIATKTFEFDYGHRVPNQKLQTANHVYNNPLKALVEAWKTNDSDKIAHVVGQLTCSTCICRHIHGHRGKIEIAISADTRNTDIEKFCSTGYVLDFNDLNILKQYIEAYLDHRTIIQITDLAIVDTIISQLNRIAKLIRKLNQYVNTDSRIDDVTQVVKFIKLEFNYRDEFVTFDESLHTILTDWRAFRVDWIEIYKLSDYIRTNENLEKVAELFAELVALLTVLESWVLVPFPPTAEWLALSLLYAFDLVVQSNFGVRVAKLAFYETPKSKVEVAIPQSDCRAWF